MENELLAFDDDRVAGIVPALIAGNDIEMFREQIDDLSLALVAPLGADNDQVCHAVGLRNFGRELPSEPHHR